MDAQLNIDEITDADAFDEGMGHLFCGTRHPRESFAEYWKELYGSEAWERDRNSWVWVYGFEVAERRI